MGDGADEIPLSSSQRCPLPSTQRPPGWGRCPSQWGGDGSGLTSSRAASWPHPWVPRRPGPPKSDQGPPPAPVRVPHSWPGGHRYPPSYTSTLPPPHPPFPLTGDPSTCPVLPGTNRHPPLFSLQPGSSLCPPPPRRYKSTTTPSPWPPGTKRPPPVPPSGTNRHPPQISPVQTDPLRYPLYKPAPPPPPPPVPADPARCPPRPGTTPAHRVRVPLVPRRQGGARRHLDPRGRGSGPGPGTRGRGGWGG